MEKANQGRIVSAGRYPEADKRGRRSRFFQWLENRSETSTAYLYLAPTLLVLLFTIFIPMLYALFISFMKVGFAQGSMKYSFIGLDNYLHLLKDARFPDVLSNTVYFTVAKVAATLVIAFGIALIIYGGMWGAALFKRIFLIPWALSGVVNSLMWQWMYSGDYGILNEILLRLGLIDNYRRWLVEPESAMTAVLVADVWKSVPYVALLLLAAMQSIPKELHEAVKADGGGPVVAFYHIILPHIKPVIMVVLVIETMWTLRVFDLIWLLTKGGPQDSTMTLNVFAYEQAFQNFDFGYGAAISYVITLLTLLFTFFYMRMLKPSH